MFLFKNKFLIFEDRGCGKNYHDKCRAKIPKHCPIDKRKPSLFHCSETSIEKLEIEAVNDVKEEIRRSLILPQKKKRYNLEDFEMLKLIGKGSFGKVFFIQNKTTKGFYAMKSLKKDVVLYDPDGFESAKLERDVMAMGDQNPFITKLICTFQSDEHLFFVMEFLNGGDLMFHMLQSRHFNESRTRFYAVFFFIFFP